MLSAKPTAIIGHVMRANALQNAKKSPCERPPASGPRSSSDAPYQKKTRMPMAATAPIVGANEPRRRASAEARVEVRALASSKRARSLLLEREAAHDAHAGEVGLQDVAHAAERRLVLAHARVQAARDASAR